MLGCRVVADAIPACIKSKDTSVETITNREIHLEHFLGFKFLPPFFKSLLDFQTSADESDYAATLNHLFQISTAEHLYFMWNNFHNFVFTLLLKDEKNMKTTLNKSKYCSDKVAC